MTGADDRALADAFVIASRALVGIAIRSIQEVADDLTVVQHRVLVLTVSRGAQPIGAIASALGVNASSATRVCDRLERLVFKGDIVNLDPRFATDRFRDDLAALGVEFLIQPYVHETKSSGWHDYTDVDAVLAIRAIHPTELSTKPASKLINAWAAGVPAILGNEPAFRELRRDPLDYVEIATPEEAIAAVRRLKEHPGDYRAMVDHGTVRATDYTNQRVAERWHAFLSGPAETAYRSWLTTTPARREAEFVVRVARQKISLFTFKRQQSTR